MNKNNKIFEDKVLGCLIGSFIGDAIGTPTEGKDYQIIEKEFGFVEDFNESGTDDTIMKYILSKTLIRTDGWGGCDEWAQDWLDNWDLIFGNKINKFFASVVHTAEKLKRQGKVPPRQAALGNMPSSSSAMCISPVGIVNAGDPQMASMQAYNLASLIHTHDVAFCQDGAASIAAATAQSFIPNTTIEEIINISTKYIAPLSGSEMLENIGATVRLAKSTNDYFEFRKNIYNHSDKFFYDINCDS